MVLGFSVNISSFIKILYCHVLNFQHMFRCISSDSINKAEKFMEISESGIMVYGPDPNNKVNHLLQLQRNRVMNDGDWHMVTFTYNTMEGRITFYLNTARHAQYQDTKLILNQNTFK